MPRVLIVGAGGHGAELSVYVRDLLANGWDGEFLGHLDDAGKSSGIMHVLGPLDVLRNSAADFFRDLWYVTAMGDNTARRRVVARMQDLYGDRITPWTLIHPRAFVGQSVVIGPGTCLAPGVIVTCRTTIGRHSILNVKVSVSHDCTVGEFVNLNPGVTICGNVRIGDGAYIGAGATVIDKVSVGAHSIIGAGAAVVNDIPANVTAVGVPARVIKRHVEPR
jgi:sugar O-acyltransferase (sialic acid O-acetyltransferase NeuD family)